MWRITIANGEAKLSGSHAIIDGKAATQILTDAAKFQIGYALHDALSLSAVGIVLLVRKEVAPVWALFIPSIARVALHLAMHRSPHSHEELLRFSQAQEQVLCHPPYLCLPMQVFLQPQTEKNPCTTTTQPEPHAWI